MPSITASRYIDAPRERVFEVFIDLERAPERIESIQKIEILTDGPIGKGTRFRETRVMFGRAEAQEMEITELEPERSYTAFCDAHGTHYVARYDFHAEGQGTRVAMRFDVTPVSLVAKVMSLAARLMMKSMKKMLEADLDALGAVAEQGAAGAGEA